MMWGPCYLSHGCGLDTFLLTQWGVRGPSLGAAPRTRAQGSLTHASRWGVVQRAYGGHPLDDVGPLLFVSLAALTPFWVGAVQGALRGGGHPSYDVGPLLFVFPGSPDTEKGGIMQGD